MSIQDASVDLSIIYSLAKGRRGDEYQEPEYQQSPNKPIHHNYLPPNLPPIPWSGAEYPQPIVALFSKFTPVPVLGERAFLGKRKLGLATGYTN
jgi:hypothetical protein